jgi:4-hydroxybenzoate polyprenyltransferase
LRPHQWLKNLLVFVPAFTAHHFDSSTWISGLLAFGSFSLCASSAYLLNDLLDLQNDRAHPTKRHRPIASGQVSVLHAALLFPVALLLSIGIALMLPQTFLLSLGLYYALTLGYSLFLKKIVIVDVVALACLYGMRLIAGGAMADVDLSPWLLTFAIFVFASLAFVKRWTELVDRMQDGKGEPAGRPYLIRDIPIVQTMAVASGYIAVLVFGMYINSPTVSNLYEKPYALWAIPLILLYWVSRIFLLTHRGQMRDDPVLFAAKDPASLFSVMLILLIVLLSL